jgi:hypothetical protein
MCQSKNEVDEVFFQIIHFDEPFLRRTALEID